MTCLHYEPLVHQVHSGLNMLKIQRNVCRGLCLTVAHLDCKGAEVHLVQLHVVCTVHFINNPISSFVFL